MVPHRVKRTSPREATTPITPEEKIQALVNAIEKMDSAFPDDIPVNPRGEGSPWFPYVCDGLAKDTKCLQEQRINGFFFINVFVKSVRRVEFHQSGVMSKLLRTNVQWE